MTTVFVKTLIRVLLLLMVLFGSSLIFPSNIVSSPHSALHRLTENIRAMGQATVNQSAPNCIEYFDARLTSTGIELMWCAFSERTIEGFVLYRMAAGDSDLFIINRNGLIPAWHQSYTDSGLSANTTYRYLLGVMFADGSESLSQPVEVTTPSQSFPAHSPSSVVMRGASN
ncbi:MAG: hypothetical protein OEN01_01015 [Candidatus Krumholzibacteria bacterium]|nr:hypothetical protein [Candidatus Krumholzibacteria bacterium]